jgi:hypothetical protein
MLYIKICYFILRSIQITFVVGENSHLSPPFACVGVKLVLILCLALDCATHPKVIMWHMILDHNIRL